MFRRSSSPKSRVGVVLAREEPRRNVGALKPRSLAASERFSANHNGGRSRAIHARNHPNIRAHTHILDAKAGALRRQEPARHRRAAAYKRLSGPYKPGLRRPVVPCTRVGLREPRTHRQVPPNQRPVPRSRNPESNKPAPMRSPLRIPKRLLRERYFDSAALCATSTKERCQAKGGRTKRCWHHRQ
jgi:hypothetical protein